MAYVSPRSYVSPRGRSPRPADQLDLEAPHEDAFWVHGESFMIPETADAAHHGNVPNVNRTYQTDVFHEEVLHTRFSPHLHILPPRKDTAISKPISVKPAAAPAPVVVKPPPQVIQPQAPPPIVQYNNVRVTPDPTRGLSIAGQPLEGQVLEAQGWYIDENFSFCNYQWQNRAPGGVFKPVPGATSRQYVLTQADVGKEVAVNVNYKGKAADAITPIISGLPPIPGDIEPLPENELLDLSLRGGPYYTNPLVLEPKYSLGRIGRHQVQWQRQEVAELPFQDIPLATGLEYRPTVDDLHSRVRVLYTPLNLAGFPTKPPSEVYVPDSFLTINPDVDRDVRTAVNQSSTTWAVKGREYDGMPVEDCTLTISGGKVHLKGRRINKKTRVTNVRCILKPSEPLEFWLTFQNKDYDDIVVCKNTQERDVIVLVIRSFTGNAVFSDPTLATTATSTLSRQSLKDIRQQFN